MPVIQSNMYVMLCGKEALVIDPSVNEQAEEMLKRACVSKCTILLTHEHFDHISGVNRLRKMFDCQVVCSKTCGDLIQNPRKNGASSFIALFLDKDQEVRKNMEAQLDPGYCCTADVVYESETTMDWHGLSILMKELPGHSKGSQIIQIAEKYVFTGDNLVPDKKTITRLPGSSRADFETKALPYLCSISEDSVIYPGHGAPGKSTLPEMRVGLNLDKSMEEEA